MARKYQERIALSSGVSSNRAFESDFGKRILMKYGWREGQGLGRLRNGRTDCLQATRREQKTGLGAEKRKADAELWDNWWADCFNSVAKRITVAAPASTSTSSTSTAQDDSDSSEDESSKREECAESGRTTAVKRAGAMRGKLRRVLRQEAPL
mmetsp:Transcript_74990/g.173920  ORF Transcript_74990/g.173920 Transcript_74990/m.173920 type:complete len:153 (+) Transcript_74990:79-537(+)|eukprot:CAMPEP_0171096954 /NCGR_PEP_ID=MMETSP0766_2-20121228/46422_1 /TAXON_ID=439317 /ORGANISM="Gambierdiscus australes, Strain CAWD 149" /LENGTH=152 /DNA_ID=CAMNT_0011556049 /DNA_START=79 /DNA_END=537 /DNA_ORIENTATION=+